MYRNFQVEGCNFFFEENEFFGRVATRDLFFWHCLTSCNIPGGSLKIIHQIRSKGFLVIKQLDPPLNFRYQKTVSLFGSRSKNKSNVFPP